MFISIFNDFSTNFSKANIRAIAANIAGCAAFVSFAACLFAFDAVCCTAAAAFVAASVAAIVWEFVFTCVETNPWCCNSEARVLRCQRRSRGFESPQRRHGIGRPVARTLACEAKDAGAIPVPSPISGRSSAEERPPWKREAGRAARPAQTKFGSVGEKQSHLPVKQSPQGFVGASPAAPTKMPE